MPKGELWIRENTLTPHLNILTLTLSLSDLSLPRPPRRCKSQFQVFLVLVLSRSSQLPEVYT